MLKNVTLWVFGILILVIVGMTAYDQFHYAQTKSYNIKCEQGSQPPGAANTLICTAENTDKAAPGQAEPPKWHVFVAWPEGITAILIAFTLGAIVWQAVATQIAARATRESVALQEAAYAQWLQLTDWKNGMEDHVNSVSAIYTRVNHLIICVSATNPSQYPLTILDGSFIFSGTDLDFTYTVPKNVLIVPSDFVEIMVEITPRGDDLKNYVQGVYSCVMSGSIRYKSIIGKITTQEFGGIVRPSLNGTDFEPYGFLHPSRRNQLADQPAENK
jgi:hypothetical protein